MADKNTKHKDFAEEVRFEYFVKFGEPPYPWTCEAWDDPRLIEMLYRALKRGTPVTPDDIDEYFPMDDGNIY